MMLSSWSRTITIHFYFYEYFDYLFLISDVFSCQNLKLHKLTFEEKKVDLLCRGNEVVCCCCSVPLLIKQSVCKWTLLLPTIRLELCTERLIRHSLRRTRTKKSEREKVTDWVTRTEDDDCTWECGFRGDNAKREQMTILEGKWML